MNKTNVTPSATLRRVLSNPQSLQAAMQLYPVLTEQQEADFVRKAQAGNAEARDLLILSNLRFVHTIARKYVSARLPLEDLFDQGVLGLIEGIDRFDATKGTRLCSYTGAYIRLAIQKYSESNRTVVAISHRESELLTKVNAIRRRLEQELGIEPDDNYLVDVAAAELDVPEQKIKAVMAATHHVDIAPRSDEDERSDDDTLWVSKAAEYNTPYDPEDILLEEERISVLYQCLDELPPKVAHAVTLLNGLNGEESLQVKEVAARLSCSTETFRHYKQQAYDYIRKHYHYYLAS